MNEKRKNADGHLSARLRAKELGLHRLSSLEAGAFWLENAGDNMCILCGESEDQKRGAEDFRRIAAIVRGLSNKGQ